MRFVVTGATSFLGLSLCRRLLLGQNEVFAVCRKKSTKVGALPESPYLSVVFADMCGYGQLHKVIDDADVFINLAWEGTEHGGRTLPDVQRQNVENSRKAVLAAKRMGCKLFVQAGSQAEYGTVLDVITEGTPCHPFSEYGKAKLRMQQDGFILSEKLDIKYLHLRIFSLYGEEDHPWTLVMSSLKRMMNNEPVDLSPCTQNWNFLYVKDAAEQIYLLCQYVLRNPKYKADVFNIASKDTRVLKDFVSEMYSLSQSKSILNFGAIMPTNIVSLDPDISKTEAATGFISDHKFKDIVNRIICKFKQQYI